MEIICFAYHFFVVVRSMNTHLSRNNVQSITTTKIDRKIREKNEK